MNLTKEELKKLLNKAFDEGACGFQDLKESFIDQLIADLEKSDSGPPTCSGVPVLNGETFSVNVPNLTVDTDGSIRINENDYATVIDDGLTGRHFPTEDYVRRTNDYINSGYSRRVESRYYDAMDERTRRPRRATSPNIERDYHYNGTVEDDSIHQYNLARQRHIDSFLNSVIFDTPINTASIMEEPPPPNTAV